MLFFFFFQAEDGIRDSSVTGVQTCALPICSHPSCSSLEICIATTSSETVLPRMISKLEQLGCERSVVGLVIPTGYSFNLDDTCLYLSLASVFLAQPTNTPLNLVGHICLLFILLATS